MGVAEASRFEGIDHVQLAAPPGSEAEARRFFGELLGLAELPKPAPLAGARRPLVSVRRAADPHRRRAGLPTREEGAPRASVARRGGARRAAGAPVGRRHRDARGPRESRICALLCRRSLGQSARVRRFAGHPLNRPCLRAGGGTDFANRAGKRDRAGKARRAASGGIERVCGRRSLRRRCGELGVRRRDLGRPSRSGRVHRVQRLRLRRRRRNSVADDAPVPLARRLRRLLSDGLAAQLLREHTAPTAGRRASAGRCTTRRDVTRSPTSAVFVPNDVAELPSITPGTSNCSSCDTSIGDYVTVTVTDAAGHFTLTGVPTGDNVPLAVQVGKWRRVASVSEGCRLRQYPRRSGPQPAAEEAIGGEPAADGGADGRLRQRRVLLAERRRGPVGVLGPRAAGRRVDVYQGLGATGPGAALSKPASPATARPRLARSGAASSARGLRRGLSRVRMRRAQRDQAPCEPPGHARLARRGRRGLRDAFAGDMVQERSCRLPVHRELDERPGVRGGRAVRGRHDVSAGKNLDTWLADVGAADDERRRGARPRGREHERHDRRVRTRRVDRRHVRPPPTGAARNPGTSRRSRTVPRAGEVDWRVRSRLLRTNRCHGHSPGGRPGVAGCGLGRPRAPPRRCRPDAETAY